MHEVVGLCLDILLMQGTVQPKEMNQTLGGIGAAVAPVVVCALYNLAELTHEQGYEVHEGLLQVFKEYEPALCCVCVGLVVRLCVCARFYVRCEAMSVCARLDVRAFMQVCACDVLINGHI